MKTENKKILLKTAREAVEAAVSKKKLSKTAAGDDAELNSHCGCFVTLKNHGELRGCIGQFVSNKPLIELVGDMAAAAAAGDPRFFDNPITPQEVKDIDIEISILSPLKKTDNPLSLRLGIDGIYIKNGFASGCLLPQVAIEAGWDREQFLSYCCRYKAGLKPDAWKDKNTDVYFFTAEIIEEEK